MSSVSFFVKKCIMKDAAIDVDITEIKTMIQAYRKQSMIQLQLIQPYTSPELAELFMNSVKVINAGVKTHLNRLSTLEKIKNNQPVSQEELDCLTKMPVFQKYEKYSNIDSVPASSLQAR